MVLRGRVRAPDRRACGRGSWTAFRECCGKRSKTWPWRAVAKHSTNLFTKLGLAPSDDGNRRVLAVLA
jgi:hypothetical protein